MDLVHEGPLNHVIVHDVYFSLCPPVRHVVMVADGHDIHNLFGSMEQVPLKRTSAIDRHLTEQLHQTENIIPCCVHTVVLVASLTERDRVERLLPEQYILGWITRSLVGKSGD